jgi:DNA-binding transcriptional MerR regulator
MSRTVSALSGGDAVPVDPAVATQAFAAEVGKRGKAGGASALVTVTDLAQELGISARTLRFYEDKGLISPGRVGAARVYSHRERARMILILRGKQLGFSLREIKSYLDLYDADPKHEKQTLSLLQKIGQRRHQLEQKRHAIEQALQGLDDLEHDANAILARINARGKKLKTSADQAREHHSDDRHQIRQTRA